MINNANKNEKIYLVISNSYIQIVINNENALDK